MHDGSAPSSSRPRSAWSTWSKAKSSKGLFVESRTPSVQSLGSRTSSAISLHVEKPAVKFDSAHQKPGKTRFEYEAKRFSNSNFTKNYPFKTCRKFRPRYAAYWENTLYVLSDNNLLKFDYNSREGKRLLQLENLMDIALTKRGDVICITNRCAVRLTKSDDFKKLRFTNAVQICCHNNNVVVLDIGHNQKHLVQFDTDGTFIRSFGADQLINADGNSKMSVDNEGFLYVYSGVKVEREGYGEPLCVDCDKYERVIIKWRIFIHVFNMANGVFVKTILVREDAKFAYKLTCNLACRKHCVDCHRYPITLNVPSNDQIARKYAVGGMCIDADGFLTLTQPMMGLIRVYDLHSIESGPRHVIASRDMKRRRADFKEPSGVCLTENEIIVCDPGRGRVQIL